jgi:hypothetical protein
MSDAEHLLFATWMLPVRDDAAGKLDWPFPKDRLPNLELQELEMSMAPSADRKDTSSSVKTGNGIHPSHCGERCEGQKLPMIKHRQFERRSFPTGINCMPLR